MVAPTFGRLFVRLLSNSLYRSGFTGTHAAIVETPTILLSDSGLGEKFLSRETGLARDYACVPRETTDLVIGTFRGFRQRVPRMRSKKATCCVSRGTDQRPSPAAGTASRST